MQNINQTVGYGGVNNPQDVLIVQTLLQQQGAKDLKVDGLYGPNTLKAIKEFQKQFLSHPDGIVSPGKTTLERLNNPTAPLPLPTEPLPPFIPILPWQNGGDKQQGSARDATRGAVYPQTVTIAMLDAVNPEGRNKQNKEILPYLNKYFIIYGISNKKEIAHFLSQVSHESFLRNVEEGLSYNTARMQKKFGRGMITIKVGKKMVNRRIRRDKLWTQADTYAHHPKNLANYIYANRMGNGSEESGDGYLYRGRGIIQITGKSAYEEFQKIHRKHNPNDKQDFVKNPNLLTSSYEYATESAVIYWVNKTKQRGKGKHKQIIRLHTVAATATVSEVTHIVNGGINGYDDRLKRFNKVAPLLGIEKENK